MLNDQFDTKKLIDSIKGHVTIELFNAKTGKLEERTESKNFIAQAGVRRIQWAQRNSYFKDQIYTLNTALDVDYQPVDTFDSIVLTDSTQPEAANSEWYMPGKPIGWANKATYVGADVLRGSPNAAQSEATSNYTKWVFDWPTNAGNGTIGSIGWMKLVCVGTRSPAQVFISNSSVIDTKTTSIPYILTLAKASSSVWFGASGNGSSVYVLDANFQQTSAFSIATQFSTYAPSGITWDSVNSKLWILGRNSGSTCRIASYSQSGTLIDGPFTITNRTYYGLAFDGTNLFTLGDSTLNTTGNSVPMYKINTSGADLATYTLPLCDYTYYEIHIMIGPEV